MTDDEEPKDDPPPKVMTPMIWVLLAFSAACVAGGVAVATLGPRLADPPPAAEAALGKTPAPR